MKFNKKVSIFAIDRGLHIAPKGEEMNNYRLTVTRVKGIQKAYEGNSLVEFKRIMQNRRIPEQIWRMVVEKDEEAIMKFLYDKKKIKDEDFQNECLPLSRSDVKAVAKHENEEEWNTTGTGRVSCPDYENDNFNDYHTSGEKEFYGKW